MIRLAFKNPLKSWHPNSLKSGSVSPAASVFDIHQFFAPFRLDASFVTPPRQIQSFRVRGLAGPLRPLDLRDYSLSEAPRFPLRWFFVLTASYRKR